MAKATTARINAEIRKLGGEEEIVRGEGYYYFSGGNAHKWEESGVYGCAYLNQMTLEQWLDEWKSRHDQYLKSL